MSISRFFSRLSPKNNKPHPEINTDPKTPPQTPIPTHNKSQSIKNLFTPITALINPIRAIAISESQSPNTPIYQSAHPSFAPRRELTIDTTCHANYSLFINKKQRRERHSVLKKTAKSKFTFNAQLYRSWTENEKRCHGKELTPSQKKAAKKTKGGVPKRTFYRGFPRNTNKLQESLGLIFGPHCFTVGHFTERKDGKQSMRCNSCLLHQVIVSIVTDT